MFAPVRCSRIRSPSSPAAAPASGSRSRRRLGELGARIAIASRNSENLERGSAALRHAGLDPLCVQLDVRNPEQVDEMVQRVVRHFGRIDILVNNAAGNFICRAEDLSPNGWNAVIGIVLNGSFYCSRAVGPPHDRARQGRRDRLDPRQLRLDRQRRHHPLGRGEGGRDVDDADARGRMGARTGSASTPSRPGRSNRRAPRSSSGTRRQAVERITSMVPLKRWGTARRSRRRRRVPRVGGAPGSSPARR